MPNQLPPSYDGFQRGTSSNNHRGGRIISQRGDPGNTTTSKEFCLSDFPGGKEGWGPETSSNPEMLKLVHEGRAFQDGRTPSPSRSYPSRRLDDQVGPKDAYLQVPIHPDHQKFLVFGWNNRFYQFKCLPFGLSTAPRIFTKLLRPVVGFLRQIGCRPIIYLDDILFLHQDKDRLSKISQLVCQLFQCLGLSINDKKSLVNSTPTDGIFRLPPVLPNITDQKR